MYGVMLRESGRLQDQVSSGLTRGVQGAKVLEWR